MVLNTIYSQNDSNAGTLQQEPDAKQLTMMEGRGTEWGGCQSKGKAELTAVWQYKKQEPVYLIRKAANIIILLFV